MKKSTKKIPMPPDEAARDYLESAAAAELAARRVEELAELVLTAVGGPPTWAFFARQNRLAMVVRVLEAVAYRQEKGSDA